MTSSEGTQDMEDSKFVEETSFVLYSIFASNTSGSKLECSDDNVISEPSIKTEPGSPISEPCEVRPPSLSSFTSSTGIAAPCDTNAVDYIKVEPDSPVEEGINEPQDVTSPSNHSITIKEENIEDVKCFDETSHLIALQSHNLHRASSEGTSNESGNINVRTDIENSQAGLELVNTDKENPHVNDSEKLCTANIKSKTTSVTPDGKNFWASIKRGQSLLSALLEKDKELPEEEIADKNRNSFKCRICLVEFTRKFSLRRHMRLNHWSGNIEADESKLVCCTQCPFKTKIKDSLRAHIRRVHDKETNYECDQCSFKSFSKTQLTEHLERIHLGVKEHRCKKCSFRGSSRSKLRAHNIKAHIGKRPHICSQCSKGFNFKIDLTRHCHKKHQADFPFKCHFCDYGSFYKRSLENHFRKQHRLEKCFKCDSCGEKFFEGWQLNDHMKQAHNL